MNVLAASMEGSNTLADPDNKTDVQNVPNVENVPNPSGVSTIPNTTDTTNAPGAEITTKPTSSSTEKSDIYGSKATDEMNASSTKVLGDPTKPSDYELPQGKEEGITHYTLEAVIISGKKKFAIINDKVLKTGDILGTAKVKSIEPYRVTLTDENGEKIVLHLFEANKVKEPVK